MKISIYSRKSIEELLRGNFPQNAAVISFYDPPGKFRDEEYKPVDYSTKTNCVWLDDIRPASEGYVYSN